jgi:hypothetical protein
MFQTKVKYLGSVFWDADSIIANPQDISTLLGTLSPENFIPLTLVEQTTEGPKNRIAFQTSGGEWQLMIAGKRANVFRNPTDLDGTNMGSLADFSLKASSYLQLLLQHFNIKANRLALVQGGLLKPMTEDEFKAIYNRLFKYPTFYSQNSPFEWNWKSVSSTERNMNHQTEIVNTLVHILRSQGEVRIPKQPEALNFDRIEVDFDINTTHRNPHPRFDFTNINSFFENAILWHQELSESIFQFVLGIA